MNSPNLHRLQIFRSVYEAMNISAASRKLGLSQPTLSRHLATLEKELGFELFHNVAGRIEPTWEAHRLYSESAGLFKRVSEVKTCIESIRRGFRESLRIIAAMNISMSILPIAVGKLYHDFPDLDLVIDGGGQMAQMAALRSHAADITVGGAVHNPVDLHQTVVGTLPLVALLAKNHPLAGQGKFDLSCLEEYGSIMHNPDAPIGTRLFEEMERRKIKPAPYISAFTIPFAIGLARHTGLCTITDIHSARYFADSEMMVMPLTQSLELDLVTLERLHAEGRQSTKAFKAALRETMQQSEVGIY